MKTHRMFLTAIVRPQSLAASLVLLAVLLAMAASNAPVVHAATITVNSILDSLGDDGYCTLREAIRNANNDDGYWEDCAGGDGADIINIAVTGTILLTSDLPTIEKAVTISGPGRTSLILDGQGSYKVLNVYCSSAGCSVNISGLTIQHGYASWGSAINVSNSSNVTLSHVTVQNNSLAATGVYGPMACSGDGSSMTLNDVNIRYNSATAVNGYAGGLYGDSGCLLFLNSVAFDHNTTSNGAGGMYTDGAATLNNVTFTNNTAGKDGGALYSGGTITVTNSTFTNNKSTGTNRFGGAILFSNGSLKGSIDTSTFTGNTADYGGAIVIGTGDANLTVTNTTFADNIAKTNGGGIMNYGAATLNSVTFSGNQVTDLTLGRGGAVDNYSGQITLTNATFDLNSSISGSALLNGTGATMTLVNNTITRNTNGPAIRTYSGITLTNTIVSDHTAGNCDLKTDGVITDGGGNLNFASHGHDCPGITADPMLYFLGYNGGYVPTRSFLAGSGAINAGNSATCAAAVGSPTFGAGGLDARGKPRRSGFCDIGAFEAQPASLSLLAGSSPQSAVVNAAFAHLLGVNVTDAYTNTLGGVTMTYSSPASGASAVLSATTANSNASGNASVTATANALSGSYSVTASATGVTPVNFNLTNTPGSTTTNITSHMPHPSRTGQAVTVVYTVASPNGTPTGSVTVNSGALNCTATVAAGSCTLTFTTLGSKTIIASYAGDGGFSASTSGSVTHTVNGGTYLPLMIRP